MDEMNRKTQEYHIVQTKVQQTDAYDLWKLCFGDTREYMDNYFTWRLKENEIISLYDKDVLTSMVHLNPYPLIVREKEIDANYIVGVATRPEYRKKGLMRQLLYQGLNDMYRKGHEFTYLMPASEAIYKPFDFRFVYSQKRLKLKINLGEYLSDKSSQEEDVKAANLEPVNNRNEFIDSEINLKNIESSGINKTIYYKSISYKVLDCNNKKEISQLISFVSKVLNSTQEIYAKRDSHYYKRLQADMRSAGGDILLFYHEHMLIGCTSYMLEGNNSEVTESIIDSIYTKSVINLLNNVIVSSWVDRHKLRMTEDKDIRDKEEQLEITFLESNYFQNMQLGEFSYEEEGKPIIMARIVNLFAFMKLVTSKKPLSLVVQVEDSIITKNQGTWEFIFHKEEKDAYYCDVHSTDQLPELIIDIATFTEIFFGYKDVDELDKGNVSNDIKTKLKKINFFQKLYLNEIV